ncbi:MAG: DNA recombination protein RmuC [Prolixibacteraceae bacterium]|jgi:DNA recombination protein RmuC|nr:DNA recombination protein RmuC [Prolixibacteraceae bacterium]
MNFYIQIIIPVISATLAGVIGYYIASIIKKRRFDSLAKSYNERLSMFEKDEVAQSERINYLKMEYVKALDELKEIRKKSEEMMHVKVQFETENKYLKEKIETQTTDFLKLQQQAAAEFENLANKILKKNTEDFSEVNRQKIHDLILPLKEKIQTFEKKVEETYEKGLKDQTDLRAELKKLYELNYKVSTEANNLTRALKGDVKKQGNWGEIVLERILERSGLTEGNEFDREKVTQNADGKTIRPDVIVNLPDKKHIIIDSKVSLLAYERYVNAEDLKEKDNFIKEHLMSLRSHIKELNNKHYSSSPQFNSPDFVLLFVPVESSFSIAVQEDQQLFGYAWDNKVVIVSPSTLLATLRTIASIWQQENQTRNAIEIARQSGAMYDKFVGFITDIEKLGKNIDNLQKNYDEASKKLYTGTGNLVRRVEKLRELGASTTKEIPEQFRE